MDDNSSVIDILLYVGYFLIAIAAIAAIVLPLIKAMDNPRTLITIGAGIVGLLIIFFIAYALSDGTLDPSYAAYDVNDSTTLKLIGGLMVTMYALLGLAFLGILVTEVSKFFR